MKRTSIPTWNYKKGRNGYNPEMAVIHIAEGSRQSVIQEFTNPVTQKSTHFLVCEGGEVIQFVQIYDTAWGNGIPQNPVSWEVKRRSGINPNLYTVSIEFEGFATSDIKDIQYQKGAELLQFLNKELGIQLTRELVIGHREIRADKTCPGKISIERLLALAHQSEDQRVNELKNKLSLLQRLVILQKQLQALKNNKFGSTTMSISPVQVALVGVFGMVLRHFRIVIPESELSAFIVGAIALGGLVWQWYQGWKAGTLNAFGGVRK